MNWLTNFVRPKIRALVAKRDVPEDLWDKCPACDAMIFRKDLIANHRVCTQCGHHLRLRAEERLKLLFDNGEYERIELPKTPVDPLRFRDSKRYVDRLREAQTKSGENDAIMVAHGQIGGINAVIAAFDFAFMGGSMGSVVGEKFVRGAEAAIQQGSPYICFSSSGGARMQESLFSLFQMAKTSAALAKLSDRGLPFISVLTHPTTGGVSASLAMLGDVNIAEPNALIGFAGARVIEQTVRQKLPEGFQRAEFLLEHGHIDLIVDRREMRDRVHRLLAIMTHAPALASGSAAP